MGHGWLLAPSLLYIWGHTQGQGLRAFLWHELGPEPRDAGMPKATQWAGWGLACFPGDAVFHLGAGPPCMVPGCPGRARAGYTVGATLSPPLHPSLASWCPARPVLEGHLTSQTIQGQASHACPSLAHLSPAWTLLSPHANSGCAAQPACLSPIDRPQCLLGHPSQGAKSTLPVKVEFSQCPAEGAIVCHGPDDLGPP